MARILAVDYGLKRVGIAVTDENQMIASPLTTIHTKDIFDFLKDYFEKENVCGIVVGEPKTWDNKPSSITPHIVGFCRKLKKIFPQMPLHRVDERFTSKMALHSIRESNLKKKDRQNKALVDKISAAIILQTYMNKIK